MTTKAQPIIVIKKKGGHGGHHGGAWKVAYADFVTAMMALFIVLWLMAQNDPVKKAVAGYFNDPKGTASLLGTTMAGNGVAVTQNDQNTKRLEELKQKLEQEIKAKKELEKLSKQIEITITPEGLRIELIEDKNGTFYQSGSAQLSASGQELLALLAAELKTLPNQLLIEGPHGRGAVFDRCELQQLGAFGGSRQLRAAAVAAGWRAQGPGDAGARIRGPDAAREEQSLRSVEPAHHDPGEESGQRAAAAIGARRGRRRRAERGSSGRRCAAYNAQNAEPTGSSAGQSGDASCGANFDSGETVGRDASCEPWNHGQADLDVAWLKEMSAIERDSRRWDGRWCSLRCGSESVYRRERFHGHRCRSRFRHTQRSRDSR